MERVILAKFPYSLVVEDITQTHPIILELHRPQTDSSYVVAKQQSVHSMGKSSSKDHDEINDSTQISSTANIKSRSWVRDERESMRAMHSRSTFDDQASLLAPNINTYLFDIEMNIEHLFTGPKRCHLMVFVHGLLGNF